MSALKRAIFLALLFLLSLAALAFGIHHLTKDNTLGGDYYISYLAGRAWLVGEDPYSKEIGTQVQLAMHKRIMGPDEDQLVFAYPPFTLLPLLPILGLPFDWSQAIWMSFCILASLLLLLFSCPQNRPRPVIFSLFFLYPWLFAIILGNYAALIFAVLVWLFSRMIQVERNPRFLQILAGLLLAWCLVKPQFSLVFCAFLLLLGLRRKEWLFPASFTVFITFFLGISFIIIPGWPALWLERLQEYTVYNQTTLISEFFFNQFLQAEAARIASLLLLAVVAITGIILLYQWCRGRFHTLLFWGFLGFAAFLIHPRGKSYEHLVFLLPMFSWLLLRPLRAKKPPILFWGGSILFSWLAFILQRNPAFPLAIAEAPFLLLPLWLLWFHTRPVGEFPADPL